MDENARKIITQLKLFYKEELRNDLCNNLSLNISKNNADVSEIQETDEINTLKIENELLKQLNTELQERNKLLNNLVNTASVKNSGSSSYLSITKSVKKIDKVPNIFVTAKNNDNSETIGKVKNKLTCDLSVPINNVRESKGGIVYVKCKNSDDVC